MELGERDAMGEEQITNYEPELAYPLPQGENNRHKAIMLGISVVVALVSFFVLGSVFSKPETFGPTINALDTKKETVMSLVGASTGSSAAITLLPGDFATPIAEKLIDLSSDFMIVLAAIYLEKYLLTILGFVSFRILIPVACALFGVSAFVDGRTPARGVLTGLSFKLLLFGIAAVLVVPSSVWVSGMIERTYQESINQTIADAEQAQGEMAEVSGEAEGQGSSAGSATNILESLSQIPNAITQIPSEVGELTKKAQDSVNNFIEALAVMIVTSCVIPVLVLFFFMWIVQLLLGININMPTRMLGPRRPPRAR